MLLSAELLTFPAIPCKGMEQQFLLDVIKMCDCFYITMRSFALSLIEHLAGRDSPSDGKQSHFGGILDKKAQL